MQQAARVSDKTAFFHLGNLIEEGDTTKIFTKPDNQKTNDYITGRFGQECSTQIKIMKIK